MPHSAFVKTYTTYTCEGLVNTWPAISLENRWEGFRNDATVVKFSFCEPSKRRREQHRCARTVHNTITIYVHTKPGVQSAGNSRPPLRFLFPALVMFYYRARMWIISHSNVCRRVVTVGLRSRSHTILYYFYFSKSIFVSIYFIIVYYSKRITNITVRLISVSEYY